jgi:hypothetical protein
LEERSRWTDLSYFIIDNDPAQKFTADMMASVKPNARRKLSGLAPAAGT